MLVDNIYQEVRRLAFSVLMRGDPADTRSVKEASEDLHNMVSLDTQFPVAFDALFLTSTVDDFLETRPCKEIEAGTHSNPGDGRAARLSPVVTRDCFVCIYHNTPFLGDGKGTVTTDAAKRAEGITSMQQMCTDSCPAINRNEVYADFEKNAIEFNVFRDRSNLLHAGVHAGFPGKTVENIDNQCYGKTYGNSLAPIALGTKGTYSKNNKDGANWHLPEVKVQGGGALKIQASKSVTVKRGGRISADGFPTAVYTADGSRDWSLWEADQGGTDYNPGGKGYWDRNGVNGGSGGSVWIETGSLHVADGGWITANGGGSTHRTQSYGNMGYFGAGGGGGRVALYSSIFDIGSGAHLEASGGVNKRQDAADTYKGETGTMYRNDTVAASVVDLQDYLPKDGSLIGFLVPGENPVIKSMDFRENTMFDMFGIFSIQLNFTMWPSANSYSRSFAQLEIGGSLILQSNSILSVGNSGPSSTNSLKVGKSVVVGENSQLIVGCVAQVEGSLFIENGGTFTTDSDVVVKKLIHVDGTFIAAAGSTDAGLASSDSNQHTIMCYTLSVSGTLSLADFDTKVDESLLITGKVNGAAFTLAAQTVVIETTGLITAEGTSNLFATTRMRSAYESFLADVATVHDASTNIYQEVRRLAFSDKC